MEVGAQSICGLQRPSFPPGNEKEPTALILINDIEKCLSADRLSAYRVSPGEPPAETMGRYVWNVALCEALYPSLNGLEVVARNTLFSVGCALHGGDGWIVGDPSFLHPLQATQIANTRAKRVKSHQPVDPPHLVADLSFGFWTGLLDRRYESHLWPRFLKQAFPFMLARDRNRKNIAQRFEHIRLLRNRVFHHEPIWQRGNLQRAHERIAEALEWISPPMAQTVAAVDRFDTVYGQGQAHITSLVAAAVGGVS
jgi:hypothetical protein